MFKPQSVLKMADPPSLHSSFLHLIPPSLPPSLPPMLPSLLSFPPIPPFLPSLQIARWPGFKFLLDLSGVDQFNHLTTATARFFFIPPPEVNSWEQQNCLWRLPHTFKCLFVPQSNYTVNFDPEIVVVDPDPETGILARNFILTYAISNATELQRNRSLGQVDIRDPFDTVQVGSYSRTLLEVNSNYIQMWKSTVRDPFEIVHWKSLIFILISSSIKHCYGIAPK